MFIKFSAHFIYVYIMNMTRLYGGPMTSRQLLRKGMFPVYMPTKFGLKYFKGHGMFQEVRHVLQIKQKKIFNYLPN